MHGKGDKQCAVPVGSSTPALDDWLRIRGDDADPLFWGLGNRNRGRRLTDQAVYNVLRKRAKQAGVERLSPHDFRRTFVGDLLDAGADNVTVQRMAGRPSPPPAAAMTAAASACAFARSSHPKVVPLLHVPYVRGPLPGDE